MENIFSCIKTLNMQALSVINKQKKGQLGDTLFDCTNIVLWRSLSATNGHVRANGAAVFFSVFPLVHPNFTKVQYQDAFEEQCSKIKVVLILISTLKSG